MNPSRHTGTQYLTWQPYGEDCAQSVALAIFVLNTVCLCLGCVNDMRFFKKWCRKFLSIGSSTEKHEVHPKTRWKKCEFQQKLVGKMCKDTKLVGVATHTQYWEFSSPRSKKWVRPHYVGVPIYDDQTMRRSERHFRSEHSFLLPGCANGVHW